jgi:hypothetical protein
MSLYRKFETNKETETSGQWFDISTDDDGVVSFNLARMGGSNKEYSRAIDERISGLKLQLKLGTISNEQMEMILLDVFLDSVLLGWKNVKGRDGSLLAYNRSNAKTLLNDLPELYAVLRELATKSEYFLLSKLEADAKN